MVRELPPGQIGQANVLVLALAAILWAAGAIWRRWRRSGLSWIDFEILFVARIYSIFVHRWRSKGFPHLPASGPVLVVSNHTCSADPTFLLAGSGRMLSFLVAREHYDVHRFTTWLLNNMRCVKVSRGCPDPASLRRGLRRLAEGGVYTIFIEGGLSGVPHNRLLRGKPGAAWLALVSRVPVFPAYIAGGPRTEHLLYSWLRPAPRPVQVIYGKPIDLSPWYDQPRTRKVLEEVTAYLMQHIAALDPKRHRNGIKDRVRTSQRR
jgi:1-acyl-sn-glycerol-3-phosphate acyltransferase